MTPEQALDVLENGVVTDFERKRIARETLTRVIQQREGAEEWHSEMVNLSSLGPVTMRELEHLHEILTLGNPPDESQGEV